MTDSSAADDLDLIRAAALEAGTLALAYRARGLDVRRKPDGSAVSDGDLVVDALLTACLRAARPDYGWLSEETPDSAERLQTVRQFLVDPIDGTSAYIGAEPWFAISIAVVQAGRPVAAVVHAPALQETFAASAGGGATLNGAPIAAAAADRLEGCRMLGDARAFASRRWPQPWPSMRLEQRNAIAYRICLVADGRFDAAVSMGWKNDWDLAAADLIAREAGALCSDASGEPLRFNGPRACNLGLVCATRSLHPLILAQTAPIAALGAP